MGKTKNKLTPKEIFTAETTHTPIEFEKLRDIFDMIETVSKVEIKKDEDDMIAKISFENSGISSFIKLI